MKTRPAGDESQKRPCPTIVPASLIAVASLSEQPGRCAEVVHALAVEEERMGLAGRSLGGADDVTLLVHRDFRCPL